MNSPLLKICSQIKPSGRSVVIAVPFAFLLLFFMVPFLVVAKISFADLRMAMPPYSSLMDFSDGVLQIKLNFSHYRSVLTDGLYIGAYLKSVEVALFSTLLCLVIGYPTAYIIARSTPARRNLLMVGVMLPFWTSYLIRIYSWIGILKERGLLNSVLIWSHVIDEPLRLYHTDWGLYIGMVYSYLPYLILPLYAHLVKMDVRLLEAARDLGAKPWKVFLTVTVPLSARGIVAGCLLVFIPAVGEYVIPELLGGADSLMIGRVMWDDFFNNTDWPVAAAAACAMVALLLIPMAWFQTIQAKELK
ncbi:ABC transporter permease subunit [Paraburkholderia sp. 1N]|uniref:ABC transporter permease subunit n=1 Tax=Paraburkholderia solitsugae TaxID=2675748 RepID=A0ABX2BKF0_9BURK|nr:ABC transporter permease subunit [Paraburkholderia solitsugae]NPT40268.1 ABC transporter permease subunit [Paraburkholderia solitsugae]